MKIKLRIYMMVVLLVALTQQMMAQQKISGRVIDVDGFAVPYAACSTEDTESLCRAMAKAASP